MRNGKIFTFFHELEHVIVTFELHSDEVADDFVRFGSLEELGEDVFEVYVLDFLLEDSSLAVCEVPAYRLSLFENDCVWDGYV